MIRLGLRLALSGGRGAVAGLALTATAVAVGTAILLFALSFAPAVADRDARTAWRDSMFQASDADTRTTYLMILEDSVGDRPLTRVHVAPADGGPDAPIPPGIAAMPGPGEAYVSPALAALMTETPADQLADRIGRVVGTVDQSITASPDELIAVIGTDPAVLRDQGALEVAVFATEPAALDLPAIGALIVVLAAIGALAPVAVFVATATRMSAARRELRLAALRLVGATPAQVARLAVVEAVVSTSIGAVGGVVLFMLARPLIARIPLDGTTWWPASIVPPLPAALAMLVAVQVVGAAAALVAMRRLTITPLGVQRRSVSPPPRATRLVPLGVSLLGLMLAIEQYRSGGLPQVVALTLAGFAFAAVIGSIALAGPWLTGIVGRVLHRFARGGAALLAARRLGDDPRGSFGAIAGVIMAVFVASAFFTFVSYSRAQVGGFTNPLLQPGTIVASVRVDATSDLVERIAQLDGVTGALPIRGVAVIRDGGMVTTGWIASCPEVIAVLALQGAVCAPSGLNTGSGFNEPGRYSLFSDAADPTGVLLPHIDIEVSAAEAPPLMASEGAAAGWLPNILLDPAAIEDPAILAEMPLTQMYVTTDDSPAAAERVRTAIIATAPASRLGPGRPGPADAGQYAEIGRIVALGLVGTLALAGCSLAVAVTTATLDRRRQFVFLRSAGMPASALRATILLQAGVPLGAVAGASALLGVIVGSAVIWQAGGTVVAPDASLVAVIAISLVIAMLIVALTLPPLERMTRPASLRHE